MPIVASQLGRNILELHNVTSLDPFDSLGTVASPVCLSAFTTAGGTAELGPAAEPIARAAGEAI